MKRLFVINIMLISVFSLCACESNDINKKETLMIDESATTTYVYNIEVTKELETTTPTFTENLTETVKEASTTKKPVETTTPEKTTPEITTQAYTVTKLDKTMYAKSSVNVRKGPSADFDKVGSLKANQQVKVTGKSDQTGWYRIEYNGTEAYVSNSYLQDKPVETTTPKPTTTKKPSGGSSNKNEETTTKKPSGEMSYEEKVEANPNKYKSDKYVIIHNADSSYDVKNTIMGTKAGVSREQREMDAYEIFMEKLVGKLEVPDGWYLTIGMQRRYNDAATIHYDIRDYGLYVMKKVGEGYCWIFDENFNLKKVSLSDTN